MRKRIRIVFTIKLLSLEVALIDVRLWFISRSEQLLNRQIILLKAARSYMEVIDDG